MSEFVCHHASSCDMYGRFTLRGALKIWQVRFCQSDTRHEQCARFVAAKEGRTVPASLLPNGEHIRG